MPPNRPSGAGRRQAPALRALGRPTGPEPPAQPLGSLLAELRAERGWSQLRLAEQLCAASGVTTVSRHEVSRWERQERVPGAFWLRWLAAVLDVPPELLMAARLDARAARPVRRAHDGRGPASVGA